MIRFTLQLLAALAIMVPLQLSANRGSTPPPSTPVLSFPTTATSGNYTVSWSWSGTASHTILQEKHYENNWQTISTSPGSSSKLFTGQDRGTYRYRAKVCNSSGGCSSYSTVKLISVGTPTASVANTLYVLLKGDINNDGRIDYFITGPTTSGRAVSDYLLVQGSDNEFTIDTTPTTAELNQARVWEESPGILLREDMSFDGYLDFVLKSIETESDEVTEIIVYANTSDVPYRSLSLDQNFWALTSDIGFSLTESEAFVQSFTQPDCDETVVSVLETFDCNSLATSWESIDSSPQGVNCAISTLYPQLDCSDGPEQYSPFMDDYYSECQNLVDGNGVYCDTCYTSTINGFPSGSITTLPATGTRQGRLGKAVIVAGGLILENLPEVCDAIVAHTTGISWKTLTVESQSLPTTDVFQRPPNCDTGNTADQTKLGRAPSSKHLRQNLNDAGCACPDGNVAQAHHIVEQKSKRANPARNILSLCGIDINAALNGVCLPANKDVQASSGTGASIHKNYGPKYMEAVTNRLQDKQLENGCQGVSDELESIANDMINGTDFWL